MALRPQCTYFTVTEPFRFFRARGSSASNSYIGSSRVHNTVYDAVNAKPGMVFHALPGGLFVVGKDGGHSAALNAPKPIFEKTYLNYTDDERLLRLQEAGKVREIPAPAGKFDYRAMGEAGRKTLPELLPEVTELEPSPEFVKCEAEVRPVLEMLRKQGAKLRPYDHILNPTLGWQVQLAGGAHLKIEWCYLPDFYRITGRDLPKDSPFNALIGKERPSLQDLLAATGHAPAQEAEAPSPGP